MRLNSLVLSIILLGDIGFAKLSQEDVINGEQIAVFIYGTTAAVAGS